MRELAEQVAHTARMLCAAGLIEAFGHVSARLDDGGLLITPTSPLLRVEAGSIVHIGPDGVVQGPADARPPLEVPMHAAIYRHRPDVAAVCRGHGPALVTFGTAPGPLPLLHGLGLLAGEQVRVHPDSRLITTSAAGDAVALALGADQALLLSANGGLAVGADLHEAATRLWFLEERARVALAAPAGAQAHDPAAWSERTVHVQAELARATAWFSARFGPAADAIEATPVREPAAPGRSLPEPS